MLNQNAIHTIEHYEALQLGDHTIITPYFNNKHSGVRAGLRVLTGKGSPSEIEEEALLLAQKEHVDLSKKNKEELIAFLKNKNLGVECSGFVFHVLNAQTDGKLQKKLYVPGSFFRKIIGSLRTAENTNVKTLAHEKNSSAVKHIQDIKPGDMIIMIGTGTNHELDHVLLVDNVEKSADDIAVHYVHSLKWNSLGVKQTGVKHGEIRLKIGQALTDGLWLEAQQTEKKNETFWRATSAKQLEIRRLNI